MVAISVSFSLVVVASRSGKVNLDEDYRSDLSCSENHSRVLNNSFFDCQHCWVIAYNTDDNVMRVGMISVRAAD